MISHPSLIPHAAMAIMTIDSAGHDEESIKISNEARKDPAGPSADAKDGGAYHVS